MKSEVKTKLNSLFQLSIIIEYTATQLGKCACSQNEDISKKNKQICNVKSYSIKIEIGDRLIDNVFFYFRFSNFK